MGTEAVARSVPEKRPDIDETETHKWLKSSGLKSETEGLIIAAQDQSLMTKQYQSEIIKNGANPKCRLCNEYNETIDHIVSGCPVLAKLEFMQRHDQAASYMHWKVCKAFVQRINGIITTQKPPSATVKLP